MKPSRHPPCSTPRKSVLRLLMGAPSSVKNKSWYRAIRSYLRQKSLSISVSGIHQTPSHCGWTVSPNTQTSSVKADKPQGKFCGFKSPQSELSGNESYVTCNETAIDTSVQAPAKSRHVKCGGPENASPGVEIVAASANQDSSMSIGQLLFSDADTTELDSEQQFCSSTCSESESFCDAPALVSADFLNTTDNSMVLPTEAAGEINYSESGDTSFHAFSDVANAIIILHHPSETVLFGQSCIRVLAGSISVFGHHLDPSITAPVRVFSIGSDFFTVITEEAIRIPSVAVEEFLYTALEGIGSVGLMDQVLPYLTSSSVILAMTNPQGTQPVEYVHSLLQQPNHRPFYLTSHSLSQTRARRYRFSLSQSARFNTLSISSDFQLLASRILHFIEDAGSSQSQTPRLLVCGERNLGKSTLLAFLMNSALNICEQVFHMECDPGQTEFTPPGCVSLTRIHQPLIGPNYTHERSPNMSCFVGGTSMQNLPEFYTTSVKKLVDTYERHGSHLPLFVNTMGWTVGIGLSLLVDVIRLVKPTHVVQLRGGVQSRSRGYRLESVTPQYILSACGWSTSLSPEEPEMSYEYLPVPTPALSGSFRSKVSPPLKRARMLLAYLGRLQLEGGPLQPINSFTPYRVPWSSVALHVCHENVLPHQIIHVVNGSWVALCQVSPSLMLDGPEPQDYKTLPAMPPNICFGFGIVRAIDVKQKYLYVITPEPLHRLRKVNALLRGDINLPDELLTSQVGTTLAPYVANVLPRNRDDPAEAIRGRLWR